MTLQERCSTSIRPIWGSEDDYGAGAFVRADFTGLALRLARIAGKFILSVNDVPETSEIFRRFAVESVGTRYTVSGKWSDVTEIIVTGPSAEPLPLARDLLSL
jgi:DNA adenine methylase